MVPCRVWVDFLTRLRSTSCYGVALVVAIATPIVLTAETRAQQALPPPPLAPSNTNALPSLAPVPPPNQGLQMPAPAGLSPLPQGAAFQTPGMAPPGMPEVKMSHYQVVVPTRGEEFATIANKMVSMGVRPDAIQARKAPLGPHLAVGPFLDFAEAQSVSSYLRSGGMDARVYFQR